MQDCKQCSKQTSNPMFCSKSCSAKHNNRGVRRWGNPPGSCRLCSTPIFGRRKNTYCSNACQQKYERKLIFESIEKDELANWRNIRNYLMETVGRCQICGLGQEWMGATLRLECDHIDGDCTNNRLSNARILCPNCHTQTPTYGKKNASNTKGKSSRRKGVRRGMV